MNQISEFWNMIISSDEQIQRQGFEKWSEFIRRNFEYRQKICKLLPESFAQIYDKTNFHDFQILGVNWNKTKKCSNVVIRLYDCYENYGENLIYEIQYREAESFTLNADKTEHPVLWGNDIFELCDENVWKHRIQCTDGAYIEIVFKDIEIKKLEQ